MVAIKGKKAEPTREELEFIYSRLEKLSDRAILEDMEEDTKFPRRSLGFITRRRKEFAAAKTVLEELVKKEFDPLLIQRKREHFNDLGRTAKTLVSHIEAGMWSDRPYDEPDFKAIDSLKLEKIDTYLGDCLLNHLNYEFPDIFTLNDWTEMYFRKNKDEIRETFLLVAHRRTFEGKCDICKDWPK